MLSIDGVQVPFSKSDIQLVKLTFISRTVQFAEIFRVHAIVIMDVLTVVGGACLNPRIGSRSALNTDTCQKIDKKT